MPGPRMKGFGKGWAEKKSSLEYNLPRGPWQPLQQGFLPRPSPPDSVRCKVRCACGLELGERGGFSGGV